ncbi:hypothetical protein ACVOMV_24280 [Mesorhizobium atlanticum]
MAQPRTVAELGDDRIAAISNLRQREDLAFTEQTGLRLCFGGLDEAPLRGHAPFDTAKVEDDARQLDEAVVAAIFAAAMERPTDRRPWLFCPMAIGGHIDHMVILKIVLRHYNALRARWRIAFYEDLHYASVRRMRAEEPCQVPMPCRAIEAQALALAHWRGGRQAGARCAVSEPVRGIASLDKAVHAGPEHHGPGA